MGLNVRSDADIENVLVMWWPGGRAGTGDHWPLVPIHQLGRNGTLLWFIGATKQFQDTFNSLSWGDNSFKTYCALYEVFSWMLPQALSYRINKMYVPHIRAFARFKNILSLFPMLLHPNYRANQYKYQIIEDKYFWQNCPWPRMLKIQKLTENNSIEYFQTKV